MNHGILFILIPKIDFLIFQKFTDEDMEYIIAEYWYEDNEASTMCQLKHYKITG